MNEEGKKIWRSEAGINLFRNALKKQPLTLQDQITLSKLHQANKAYLQDPPKTEPEPTENLGTVGCFHGDPQTSQRNAAYLYDNGISEQAQIRQIQKDIESKMDELAKLGIDIGDFRGELHKRLSAAHDAGQSEVRAPGAQREASSAPGEADAAAEGDAGSRGASGSNASRRRITLVRDDGDLKSPNQRLTLIEEPIQDDLFRQQLDLFLDSDPAGQSGPKNQAARREAVAAVESLLRDS